MSAGDSSAATSACLSGQSWSPAPRAAYSSEPNGVWSVEPITLAFVKVESGVEPGRERWPQHVVASGWSASPAGPGCRSCSVWSVGVRAVGSASGSRQLALARKLARVHLVAQHSPIDGTLVGASMEGAPRKFDGFLALLRVYSIFFRLQGSQARALRVFGPMRSSAREP